MSTPKINEAARRELDPYGRGYIEFCRACRDERDVFVPAEFIVWGKLTPPEHLGPQCYDHTEAFVGGMSMSRIGQWAIYDLRPLNRLVARVERGAR